EGRVSSVTKFGLFIELDRSGAHALVPMGLLPDDRYDFDPKTLMLEGRRWGRVFSLSQRVQMRLVEADGLTGSLVGEVVGDAEPSALSQLMTDSALNTAPPRSKKRPKSKGKAGQKPKRS
ncbi:MAG: S1 RNA-binding domain-containing protein, partial [Alphaproteobacteria bacterium TMED89]